MSRTGGWGVRPGLALGCIVTVAAFLRVLHVVSYETAPTNDMAVYVRMAREMITFGKILSPESIFWFPPGYAFFLKPFFMVFGEERALMGVRIAQALLGAATCILTYRLARRAHSTLAGLAAALATTFHMHFLFYTSAYMSETLFIFLYFAGLLAALGAGRRPGKGRLYRAGLLAGAAVLVRPVAASLAPALLAACWKAAPGARGRLRAVALVLAGGLTLIAPWAARNWMAHEQLILVAPNGPFNLAVGNHAGSTGRYTTPPSISGDLWDRMEDFRHRALDFILSDPFGALFVTLRLKWLAFWELIPPWPLYSSNPLLFAGSHFFPVLSWRVTLALGAAGLGFLASRRKPGWWVAPACLACYIAIYMVFFGNSRFRLPAEGFFLVWAGVALAGAARACGRLGRIPVRKWAAGACLLLALILAQGGLRAVSTRASLRDPAGILAAGEQFPVIPSRSSISVFEEEILPVDRDRGHFLELSTNIYRMGPRRDTPDNGLIRLEFRDGDGHRLHWLSHATYFLEALPADRWVPLTIRAHIPPAARSLRALLIPAAGSPDTVIVDRTVLRYSRGNDPALESLLPYLRYAE